MSAYGRYVKPQREARGGVISIYDNTSGVPQDSMAQMILYIRATDMGEHLFKQSR